jgi:hypothetical protein
MPDRRKGPSDRRRRDASKEAAKATEQLREENPEEAAAIDADQLDASIRARQQEDRGEVF